MQRSRPGSRNLRHQVILAHPAEAGLGHAWCEEQNQAQWSSAKSIDHVARRVSENDAFRFQSDRDLVMFRIAFQTGSVLDLDLLGDYRSRTTSVEEVERIEAWYARQHALCADQKWRQGLAAWARGLAAWTARPETFSVTEWMLLEMLTNTQLSELSSGQNAAVDEFAAKMVYPVLRPHVPAAPKE